MFGSDIDWLETVQLGEGNGFLVNIAAEEQSLS